MAVQFRQHKGYVRNKKLDQATGFHFNQRGHDIADMQVLIIEKKHSTDGAFSKEREKMYINLFNTSYRGINKQRAQSVKVGHEEVHHVEEALHKIDLVIIPDTGVRI